MKDEKAVLELLYKCQNCGEEMWAKGHEEDQEFLAQNDDFWPFGRLPMEVPMNKAHVCKPNHEVMGIMTMVGYRVVEE